MLLPSRQTTKSRVSPSMCRVQKRAEAKGNLLAAEIPGGLRRARRVNVAAELRAEVAFLLRNP